MVSRDGCRGTAEVIVLFRDFSWSAVLLDRFVSAACPLSLCDEAKSSTRRDSPFYCFVHPCKGQKGLRLQQMLMRKCWLLKCSEAEKLMDC